MGYSNIECGNVVVIAHPPFILRSPVKQNLRFPSLSNKIARSAERSCGTKIRDNTVKYKGMLEQRKCQLTKSRAYECYVQSGWRNYHMLFLCVVCFLCTYKNTDSEGTFSLYKTPCLISECIHWISMKLNTGSYSKSCQVD
jgi:hypothetical protein